MYNVTLDTKHWDTWALFSTEPLISIWKYLYTKGKSCQHHCYCSIVALSTNNCINQNKIVIVVWVILLTVKLIFMLWNPFYKWPLVESQYIKKIRKEFLRLRSMGCTERSEFRFLFRSWWPTKHIWRIPEFCRTCWETHRFILFPRTVWLFA